jgi:hypothetical protein
MMPPRAVYYFRPAAIQAGIPQMDPELACKQKRLTARER